MSLERNAERSTAKASADASYRRPFAPRTSGFIARTRAVLRRPTSSSLTVPAGRAKDSETGSFQLRHQCFSKAINFVAFAGGLAEAAFERSFCWPNSSRRISPYRLHFITSTTVVPVVVNCIDPVRAVVALGCKRIWLSLDNEPRHERHPFPF